MELLEIEHHLNMDLSIKHNLVYLPTTGLCKERLVAIFSLSQYAKDQPLMLFEGPERASVSSETEAIRARVSSRLPPYMLPTVWIVVTALPQLSSGKLDRKRVMQWLTNMPVDVYQRAIPATTDDYSDTGPTSQIQATLRSIWAHVLNLTERNVSMDSSFMSLGGDSISAMQVMGQCRKKGIGLGVQDILRSRSIPQLAVAVKDVCQSFENTTEDVETSFTLTPIQALWFQLPKQGRGHFNQSFYVQIKRKTTPDEFRAAVEALVSRHSMLRSRFFSSEHGWEQRVTGDVAKSYRFRYQKVSGKHEIEALIEDCQTCLNHTVGPMFAADLFEVGNDQRAFLVAHHLVVDLVSWRVLLEELEDILKSSVLLPLTLPFQTWARLQQEHVSILQLDEVLPPVDIPPLDFSYWGIRQEDNTYGNAAHAGFELDPRLTAAFLGGCHTPLNTEPVEVLLASLIHSWRRIFHDRACPAIFNEGHGREPWTTDIDVSRTVGWFTTCVYLQVRFSFRMHS